MRIDPIAGLGKRPRFCYILPVAQPARHRPKRPKTLASGDPGIRSRAR
jgi:hypothetical protein